MSLIYSQHETLLSQMFQQRLCVAQSLSQCTLHKRHSTKKQQYLQLKKAVYLQIAPTYQP